MPGDGVKLYREDRGINKGMENMSGSEIENLENRGKVMNLAFCFNCAFKYWINHLSVDINSSH